jgi:hypothetical protein
MPTTSRADTRWSVTCLVEDADGHATGDEITLSWHGTRRAAKDAAYAHAHETGQDTYVVDPNDTPVLLITGGFLNWEDLRNPEAKRCPGSCTERPSPRSTPPATTTAASSA